MKLFNSMCVYFLQVLGIRQGELDLHGRPRNVTWVRLEETAWSNTTVLHVQVRRADVHVAGASYIATCDYHDIGMGMDAAFTQHQLVVTTDEYKYLPCVICIYIAAV